jgi:aryl-alcohol dehydrogenase-like predicted oxidoreductase
MGLTSFPVGLGCVGMSEFYGPVDRAEASRAIRAALDEGITLIDTADIYGLGDNERLLGRALSGRRSEALIATKFGNIRTPSGEFVAISGRPEYVRKACEASLRRLRTDVIDLYQQHRVDPATPIEETVGAMHELVVEGKVRFLGVSETQPSDLRRAAQTAPIATLQSEYSLLERSVEGELLPLCAELGIGFLAYSPLGRGLLTGQIHDSKDFEPGDARGSGRYPRLSGRALAANVLLARVTEDVARDTGASSTQVAIAWLLSRASWIVPIPGTKRASHVRQNAQAAELQLSRMMMERLDAIVGPGGHGYGERYARDQIPSWTSPPVG